MSDNSRLPFDVKDISDFRDIPPETLEQLTKERNAVYLRRIGATLVALSVVSLIGIAMIDGCIANDICSQNWLYFDKFWRFSIAFLVAGALFFGVSIKISDLFSGGV